MIKSKSYLIALMLFLLTLTPKAFADSEISDFYAEYWTWYMNDSIIPYVSFVQDFIDERIIELDKSNNTWTVAIVETWSFLLPIITEKQQVIGSYPFLWTKRNIYSIPQWKYDMMKKKWFDEMKILHYSIINMVECGDELWNCDSWSDSGPFQINRVHPKDYSKSEKLRTKWKWMDLYEFQLDWTNDSLEWFKTRLCKKPTENETFWCMLRNHNWNVKNLWGGVQFRDVYANKGLEVKKIILSNLKEWKYDYLKQKTQG